MCTYMHIGYITTHWLSITFWLGDQMFIPFHNLQRSRMGGRHQHTVYVTVSLGVIESYRDSATTVTHSLARPAPCTHSTGCIASPARGRKGLVVVLTSFRCRGMLLILNNKCALIICSHPWPAVEHSVLSQLPCIPVSCNLSYRDHLRFF